VPRRVRIQISRRRNDDEDAKARPLCWQSSATQRRHRVGGSAHRSLDHAAARCNRDTPPAGRAGVLLSAARIAAAPPALRLAVMRARSDARALAVLQEELYSYVTVVDTPEGFANLGTKTVETA
jgi:hypothetical protein